MRGAAAAGAAAASAAAVCVDFTASCMHTRSSADIAATAARAAAPMAATQCASASMPGTVLDDMEITFLGGGEGLYEKASLESMDVLIGAKPDWLAPSRNEERMHGKTTAENTACKTKPYHRNCNKNKVRFDAMRSKIVRQKQTKYLSRRCLTHGEQRCYDRLECAQGCIGNHN